MHDKLFGLYLDYKITSPEVKDKIDKRFSGWKPTEQTPLDWLKKFVDQGKVVVIADADQCPTEKKYRHAKDLWNHSYLIGLDADEVEYVDDGEQMSGVKPFDGTYEEWSKLPENEELMDISYAIGESISSMRKGEPKHRRFRIWVLLEEPITNLEDYSDFLAGMHASYPIITGDDRSPMQPVFGAHQMVRELRGGKIREDSIQNRTKILKNTLNKHQINTYINKGRELKKAEDAFKVEAAQEKRKKMLQEQQITASTPQRKAQEQPVITEQQYTETIIDKISKDFDLAKSFLEQHGSTYAGFNNDAHRFHRDGKDDGEGELLFVEPDGRLVFYAHSGNSSFVQMGILPAQVGMRFGDLYVSVEFPTGILMKQVVERFPHLDNGWRPEQLDWQTVKPWKAFNWNLEAARKYVVDVEGEEHLQERNVRIYDPEWKPMVAVDWMGKTTPFSDYFAYMEAMEAEAELIENYDTNNLTHRTAFVKLNNRAAEIIGYTGGWTPIRARRKRQETW